jgi:cytochrome c oxidase cbb3-type subunit 4
MEGTNTLHIVSTVITFITFIGIVGWAYSKKRKVAFDDAANAPFALPDDADAPPASMSNSRTGRPS